MFRAHRSVRNSRLLLHRRKSLNLTRRQRSSATNIRENSESSKKTGIKVCILGGGKESIFTSVLLKQSSTISSISLVDMTKRFMESITDANQIDTGTTIQYFTKANISCALKETDIIALFNETDLDFDEADSINQFDKSANYIYQITEQIVQCNPEAIVIVFVQPVTAVLPLISEIYNFSGCWNPNRIIGSTAIYSMHVDALTANYLRLNQEFLFVPLVGGADRNTIVPLFSCVKSFNQFTNAQLTTLLQMFCGTTNDIAFAESRRSVLSSSAAASKFILTLARALSGRQKAVACAFVQSRVLPGCDFFTSQIQFGRKGIEKHFGLPKASSIELSLIDQAIPIINKYRQTASSIAHTHLHKNSKTTSM